MNAETYKYYLTIVIGSHPDFSLLASIHKTSDVVRDAIKQQLHMKVKTIPTYTPDLNPTEHMFKPLKDEIAKQHVRDEQQLMMAIKTAYDKISIQQTNTLATHMKHTYQSVMDNKGSIEC